MTDETTKPMRFLDWGDLMKRWNYSRQTLERKMRNDPDFPPVYTWPGSKIRKCKEHEVEHYEQKVLTRRGARS
jgi:hypothetical protein